MKKGFTLIELLIVIGLLGALTALVLPSLSADREEALGDVCDYNQAGTVRVLKQYNQLTQQFPDDMHTGLQTAATGGFAMVGLPTAQAGHMGDGATACPSLTTAALTAGQIESLAAAGVDSVCEGTGFNSIPLWTDADNDEEFDTAEAATDVFVVSADGWLADDGLSMTFDGVSVADWQLATAPDGKTGEIVVFWIAPTVNWDSATGDNKDWGNGNVSLGLDLEGQCPIPAASTDAAGEVTFAYYMAYFKAYDDGTPARLIGTTCPECGVMNP